MREIKSPKLKLFYILDYLEKYSHEDRLVKAPELIAMLDDEYGISCDRKTIYSDISALLEYGIDIVSVPGKNGGYYIASPKAFELSELKLLIDAVQSSRYLTEKKSSALIKKLCELCIEHDASLLKRNVFVSGRVKSMNESILHLVDNIHKAITQNRQIKFRYYDWDLSGKESFREKEYLASPYGLCQDNENYYLLAFSDRHGVTSYRVDRMKDITITDIARVPCPELTGKALVEYANRRFQMYSGDLVHVKMRFHRSLVNVVIDRFGKDTMLIPDGQEHFTFSVPVAVSPIFLSWVISFGGKAQILYPESVIDQCRQLCSDAMLPYQQA